jgi:hypothetical protein
MKRIQIPRLRQSFTALVGALIVLSFVTAPAQATHSWWRYHWQRTTNPVTLKIVDNTTNGWSAELGTSVGEWDNGSSVLTLQLVTGSSAIDPSKCGPVAGTIQVCNANYGGNGWMGIAQIWTQKDHITQANAKLNDYYFTPARYTSFPDNEEAATLAADRLLVMCQEVAHDFGLDHQDETFRNVNLGSCMDYTDDPNGGMYNSFEYGPTNEHPNAHDFTQLASIYGSHIDGTSGTGGKKNRNGAEPTARSEEPIGNSSTQWGEVIATDGNGRPSHYKKVIDPDRTVFTFVIYADKGSDEQAGPGSSDGGHSHDGTVDTGGRTHDGDHGKQADSKRDGGKKADSKRDGGKRDGGKQRQRNHDRHNH